MVQADLKRLEHHYKRILRTGSENALLRAVFRAFLPEISIQMLLNVFDATLTFGSPFLVMKLIDFIQNSDPATATNQWDDIQVGVYLALGIVGCQFVINLLNEHLLNWQALVGVRSSNAVITMIYNKHCKISSATNKEFT